MDILSHGLWGGVIAKAANRTQPKLSYLWSFWWGVFPDLIAFGIPFLWLMSTIAFGPMTFGDITNEHRATPLMFENMFWFGTFAPMVYRYGHSLMVFVVVFAAAYLIFRRPVWELFAWFLHILMDIPTHTTQFYPTPFLWPISDISFSGISWGVPWFMAVNYGTLILFYIILRVRRRAQVIPLQDRK